MSRLRLFPVSSSMFSLVSLVVCVCVCVCVWRQTVRATRTVTARGELQDRWEEVLGRIYEDSFVYITRKGNVTANWCGKNHSSTEYRSFQMCSLRSCEVFVDFLSIGDKCCHEFCWQSEFLRSTLFCTELFVLSRSYIHLLSTWQKLPRFSTVVWMSRAMEAEDSLNEPLSLSLSLLNPLFPAVERRACFWGFLRHAVELVWTSDEPTTGQHSTETQTQTSMPWAGFEPKRPRPTPYTARRTGPAQMDVEMFTNVVNIRGRLVRNHRTLTKEGDVGSWPHLLSSYYRMSW
jgi:hypothetical protein